MATLPGPVPAVTGQRRAGRGGGTHKTPDILESAESWTRRPKAGATKKDTAAERFQSV